MPKAVLALARSSHPGPTFAVTIVTVVLSIGAGLEPWRIVLIGFAMLFDQLSVGWSNDWIDVERDRKVGRADKPVALGLVSASVVRAAAIVSAVLALALTVPLGWAATLAHAIALGSAWSYNAWLKNTPLSVLPFVVSFGLLPSIVTLSAAQPAPAAWWATGAGALLGVAAHFANVLPDLESDRATGIRGLPHRVGAVASGIVIAVALGAASVLVVLGPGTPGPWQLIGLGLALVIAVACVILSLGRPTRLLFRLIIAGALLDVALLVSNGAGLISNGAGLVS